MSFNASNYVVTYRTPSAPRITVDVRTVTTEELNSAITVYQDAALDYASQYSVIVANNSYVADRLMKDMCAEQEGLTSGGIDYENNTITLHEKANEVYEYAVGSTQMTSVNAINNVKSSFDQFYSTYYQDDAHESTIIAPVYATPVTYDSQAYVVDADVESTTIASGQVFIKDIANATGTGCTYTNYDGSGVAQMSISYQTSAVGSDAAWVVADVTGSSAVGIAYSVATTLDSAVWTKFEDGE